MGWEVGINIECVTGGGSSGTASPIILEIVRLSGNSLRPAGPRTIGSLSMGQAELVEIYTVQTGEAVLAVCMQAVSNAR